MNDSVIVRPCADDAVDGIARESGLPRIVAQVLCSRGICEPEEVERFLDVRLSNRWRSPYEIPGMEGVVDRLESAIRSGLRIVVFGDFDVDGITSTALMVSVIRRLGGIAEPLIPKRIEEGYGITPASIERIASLDPNVVLTVDCGISCAESVDALKGMGIEVIVTDHHEAGDHVPEGIAICDPKYAPGSEVEIPEGALAGVGVALKVASALGARLGRPHLWQEYTDLAALGTISDLMPMLGENRAIVADGLARINSSPRPGIRALSSICNPKGNPYTSTNVGFSISPRLNAAGRVGDAKLAFDLLMAESDDRALELAAKLEEANCTRKKLESDLAKEAEAIADEKFAGQRALLVWKEGWHEGVKGIVASRLASKYGACSIVLTIEDGIAKGSGRSVGSVNLYEAVASASHLLETYGGHASAVGVSLKEENLPAFEAALCESLDHLPEEEFRKVIKVDGVPSISDFDIDSIGSLSALEPFGQSNPEPVFLFKNVTLEGMRAVGPLKNHLSCTISDGKDAISAISFNCDSIDKVMETSSVVDVVFSAEVNEWHGRKSPKAMVKSIIQPGELLESPTSDDDGEALDALSNAPSGDEDASDRGPSPLATEGEVAKAREQWPLWLDGETDLAANPSPQDSASVCEAPDLMSRIVSALIGNGKPHDAQLQLLDKLDSGISSFGIMATGRGKSLVFQAHAARLAISEGKASIFVYPLRALMSDQAFHLKQRLAPLGIRCEVLSGETSQEDRERIYATLESGSVDIVLTTPEYLHFNAKRIGDAANVGFMVVDEAHHIATSKAGSRDAYRELAEIADTLGSPTVLAMTATAPDEVSREVRESLGVADVVVDRTLRENLKVDDARGIRKREDYLASICAAGGKCIVYVNSREQTLSLCRSLRKKLPNMATRIGFYNAGLSREERMRIEGEFRAGNLSVLVSTSAFGEGIDIPDVRDVVLFNLPFSKVELSQMGGRCGRDGKAATVHLLYERSDVRTNESLLSQVAPDRKAQVCLYREIRSACESAEDLTICGDGDDLCASLMRSEADGSCQACRFLLSVFAELGLISMSCMQGEGSDRMRITYRPDAPSVSLEDSALFAEGRAQLQSFMEFKDWALSAPACEIEALVQGPLA